jgi:hypothetical protein
VNPFPTSEPTEHIRQVLFGLPQLDKAKANGCFLLHVTHAKHLIFNTFNFLYFITLFLNSLAIFAQPVALCVPVTDK